MMTETVFCEKCNLYVLDTEGCEHLHPDAAGLREQFAEIIVDEMANTKDGQGAAYDAAGRILALLPTDAAVKALVEALAPFARAAGFYEILSATSEDQQVLVKQGSGLAGALTVRDFRRAATLAQHGVK